MSTSTAAQDAVRADAPHSCAGRFARVKSVRRTTPEPVYNMEVERYHNFAVNGGLIVHNCIDSARYALEAEISRRRAETRRDF